MYNKNHAQADANYITIGDSILIQQRSEYPVGINPPNGLLGDYVPFYFGPLSPMLYNIATGYRAVTKRAQEDIIYICCSVKSIIDNCEQWCFTDGHAKNAITTFYNNLDLKHVDIQLTGQRYWNNTEDDFDRMRKKQAEFLVKSHVPPNCIKNIVVYNAKSEEKVNNLVKEFKGDINIHVNPNKRFYY